MEDNYAISKKALYEMIADNLEKMILNHEAELEETLPSEHQLADKFGVSRPVVREALKLLKERGLIASRQGASTVVTEYSMDHFSKSLNRVACMKQVSPEQFYQIRIALEGLSSGLAARYCTEEDSAKLKEINDFMRRCTDDVRERARLDLEFHNAIAHMSHNPLLSFMTESLSVLLQPLIEKSINTLTDIEGILLHDQLITVIQTHQEEKAEKLMKEHLRRSIRNYKMLNEERYFYVEEI